MLRKGEERAVEVPVRNKNYGMSTGVGPKGEDACDCCFRCCHGAVVTGTETAFNARAISKG